MLNWKEVAKRWSESALVDAELKRELAELEQNPAQLEDAFYRDLEFGTGGMRGVMGIGTNRMNVLTIRKASLGLAHFILHKGEEAKNRGVVIAYDSRHQSYEFALEAATTLASNGIKTYVFQSLRPTPQLSFTLRHLKAFSGIVITASHNPPEYNGFKVYGEDGAQLEPISADEVIDYVRNCPSEVEIEVGDRDALMAEGLIQLLDENYDEPYVSELTNVLLQPALENKEKLSVVFTPLHGTATAPLMKAFERTGYANVQTVEEQVVVDPNFSTVKSPNPEEKEAFTLAMEKGKKVNADLLLATDPDADRLGCAVKTENGDYTLLTGNQTGAVLLHYILSQRAKNNTLPENGIVFKTIVTSELGRKVAAHFGIPTEDVLTGFKFIGEKIRLYQASGEHTFLFGYEESYGYLLADFARDKDALQAAVMLVEAAAYYQQQGLTLVDVLHELYELHGFHIEALTSVTLKGKDGLAQMGAMMESLRHEPVTQVGDTAVVAVEDYQLQKRFDLATDEQTDLTLPPSNVIKLFLEDGTWICVRPSGTEPKIKYYYSVQANSGQEAEAKLAEFKQTFEQHMTGLSTIS
ncbi:phospho-sugar mutase [Mangrovibacillus cuniculi]|uniref:Phosphoglucomutase n=1 Tax=Mangrovibacillus cuniculi TaxID=2593652 RepID=A0A7S8HEU8_9BACI|nr:phospho-sugar mutase [Mangrovibacillus cuniculi]QPC45846.1 phospho-sugar mutase [Mangrovibacillus cuniculi]